MLAALVTAALLCPLPAGAQENSASHTIARGMHVNILKNDNIPFVHAELVIHYRYKPPNPAIPYLTFLNIFDRDIKKTDTSVLNNLRRLGNDFEVEHRPDFVLIKVNFLPGKMSQFIKFLKSLYNYKPLLEIDINPATYLQRNRKINTRARFKDSIANYWKYFFKKQGWKKRLAYQVAYDYLFPGTVLGNGLITPDGLNSVTLENLSHFYKQAYRLNHSQLFLKGKTGNVAVAYGSIVRAFSTAKKIKLEPAPIEKITITNRKKIIVFNTGNSEAPSLFWFEPIDTRRVKNPAPVTILNNLLFGYPAGRIFITATRFMNIGGLRLSTEMIGHKSVSVICNTIRLRYRDIERFILLAGREQKKLEIKGVGRKEFLDTKSYIAGRLKVNTRDIDHDIALNIVDMPVDYPAPTRASLSKNSSNRLQPVIIIVGNAALINRYLSGLRSQVQVIDFFK
jgi:hypothetical protein